MNENMDRMELSLEDLEQVVGAGALENLYNYYKSYGFIDVLKATLPQGKKAVVNRQNPFLHEHAAELRKIITSYPSLSDWEWAEKVWRDYGQKIYGML